MMKRPKALKNSNKAWAAKRSLFPACILISLIWLSAPAHAKSTTKQELIYEVYAGGIHAVQAKVDVDLKKKDRYSIILNAHTRGFLARLVPWKGTFESHGWSLKDRFQPQTHKSTTGWKEELDIKEYSYNKNGTFKSLRITDEHSDNELREVAKDLTDQTTDVLSATLAVMNAYNETQKCEGEAEIFDGKRRFKQSFKPVKNTQLKASKYNIYGGAAAECVVEVTPIAGEWHKKPRGWMSIQEQGRDRGMMPTLWLGKLSKDGPAVPVKIRVKTAYGTLFMHLAEYTGGDQNIVAEKRMKD